MTFDRRKFLKLAVSGALLSRVQSARAEDATDTVRNGTAETLTHIADPGLLRDVQQGVTRHWLGPHFWGNRLQDWQLKDGWIKCIDQEKGRGLRTVSILTREINGGLAHGRIRASFSGPRDGAEGFGGFLVGAGAGKLDYRAAALVQKVSGEGGGILAVFGTDGKAAFREHTSEHNPFKYAVLPAEVRAGKARYSGGGVVLTLDILPATNPEEYELVLTAEEHGAPVSTARLRKIRNSDLQGGIMLVSGSLSESAISRFSFSEVETSGDKISEFPERALGPILGTLYSVNRDVMKLTAQLMPLSESDPQEVTLWVRPDESKEWKQIAVEQIERGYSATFRIAEWDDSRDWEYRVSYPEDGMGRGRAAHYTGNIYRDPRHKGRNLTIGLYSCTMAVARPLDEMGEAFKPLPQSQEMGRYTPQSMYFPFTEIITYSLKHKPDIAVFAGDQFYEGNPTRKVPEEAPVLDYLYKYYLWLWSFRDLTRDRPTIVLIDDHDVYQGNVWGAGGRRARDRRQELGGYTQAAEWVNMVQQTQCGHNPDP